MYEDGNLYRSRLRLYLFFWLQGSRDNMSIVIIAFEGAPKVSEEAKQKEKELDARLEEKIKGRF